MKKFSSGAWVIFVFVVCVMGAILILNQKPISLINPARPPLSSPLEEAFNATGTTLSPTSSLPILAPAMPSFSGITQWYNTENAQALTPEYLKGKVVLIDFWTYSCINCIRTQPVLKAWWNTYKKDGLVIIGVHTPEFAFEKDPKNVGDAIQKAGLLFPIALDANYGTWNAYSNHYWPAEYFFDRQGRLRHTHFGEGKYAESETVIRQLLAEGGSINEPMTGVDTSPKFDLIKTPETYFGYERAENFINQRELKKDVSSTYTLQNPKADQWSIGGDWTISSEKALGNTSESSLRMNVQTNAMHVVMGSMNSPRRVQILIDGKNPSEEFLGSDAKREPDGRVFVSVTEQRLYRIAIFPNGDRHTVEYKIVDPGIEFYATTFGE